MPRDARLRNNLAHCFVCNHNFNNIDLLCAAGYRFTADVALRESWLARHESR